MRVLFSLVVFLVVVTSCLATESENERVHFYNHKVLRASIMSEDQEQLVYRLGLDVWSHDSTVVFGLNDIMVNEEQEQILRNAGIEYEVWIPNVEDHLERERSAIRNLASQPTASWFDVYHNLSDINAFYQSLVTSFPARSVKFIPSIGKSIQGRDIFAITFGNANGKKRIYYEGGQHAREWIGHATVAYITQQLLTNYGTDSVVKDILDNTFFVVVPVVNPDGYEFTWSSNRLWRKNRRLNTGGSYGVDLNRNWNDHWGGSGSSSSPSSDTYHGTAPFSEPETKACSEFYLDNGPYDGAIDWHSYSQLILRPYGWSNALPPNDAESKKVGDGIRDTIKAAYNLSYTSEPSWQLYYTAGTAQDWFYAAGKTPLAYTIELRDTGTYGFQLPPAQIIPCGEENYRGFKFFANYIVKN